jgi:CRISPR-associated protein Csm4
MKAYKLKFHSSFHIDAGTAVDGPSETFIHSDTLFSALVSATRKFYGDELAEKFLEPKSVIISSAFPYYKEEYFLPKPLHYFPKNLTDYSMIKTFKKAKFISKEILLNILYDKPIDSSELSEDSVLNGCWRSAKGNTNTKQILREEKIYEVQEVPHIVMDRVTNQTQIYYKTEVYFSKDAGLYFIADVKENLTQKFETVLRFLGDEGIGADRTIGKGLFDVQEINDFNLQFDKETEYYYSLSLYSPTKEEFDKIDPKKSFYDFLIRGGWISNNTFNRKSLRMFVEGSVLYFTNKQKPVGSLQKVLAKKDYENDLIHDIYRSGQALFFPITGGINGNN